MWQIFHYFNNRSNFDYNNDIANYKCSHYINNYDATIMIIRIMMVTMLRLNVIIIINYNKVSYN